MGDYLESSELGQTPIVNSPVTYDAAVGQIYQGKGHQKKKSLHRMLSKLEASGNTEKPKIVLSKTDIGEQTLESRGKWEPGGGGASV